MDREVFAETKIRGKFPLMTPSSPLTSSPRARKAAFSALLLFVLAGTSVIVSLGAAHQEEFGHDLGIFLDGAWRVLQGQRPHVDFHTPIGPLTPLLFAFAMKVATPTVNAIGYGIALLFPVLTMWAWWLASRRMPAPAALLFSLFVGGCVASMFPFGYAFVDTSYAGLYNRIGYAVLSLVLIETFLTPTEDAGRGESITGGASTGILASLLCFLKINFFAVACIAIIVGVLLLKRTTGWRFGFLAGFLLIALPMLVYLDFQLTAVLSDLYHGAAIRGASSVISRFAGVSGESFAGIFLLFVMWLYYPSGDPNPKPSGVAIGGMTLFLWGAYLFLAATNMVMKEAPLYPVPAFILLEHIRRATPVEHDDGARRSYLIPFLLTLYLMGRVFVPDIQGIVHEMRWRDTQAGNPALARFQPDRLAPVVVSWSAATCDSVPYAVKLNDGMSLLSRHVNPVSRILVMDYTNLFSFALSQDSPRGDALWWHYGATFNERFNWSPREVFREVSIIMAPKCEEDRDTVVALWRLYGVYIAENYRLTDETQFWRLLEKRGIPPAAE